MKINIENAKKEFLEYTQKYDLKNENIERKQQHSLRVANISKEIATKMDLTKEDIQLAELIGLLHDIARFEQYTQFQTFSDIKSFDHGDYGVQILEKDLGKYIETDKYDDIIKKAIKNHNKFQIEEGLTQKEKLFAKIIRDADKLDIFYESIHMFWKEEKEEIENSEIDDIIYQTIKNNKTFKRGNNVYKGINKVLMVIAFIFDINFKTSFEILMENDYINKILDRFELKNSVTKEKIEEIKKIANRYIENEIENI